MALKISTKGRYGLRALIDLSMNTSDRPVLLADIARRQGLSKRYLERLFTLLRASGLIRSVRGAAGGYILDKHPAEIKISDVLEILEGPIKPVDCVLNRKVCRRTQQCATHDLWIELGESMKKSLENTTLEDLRLKQVEISENENLMFYI